MLCIIPNLSLLISWGRSTTHLQGPSLIPILTSHCCPIPPPSPPPLSYHCHARSPHPPHRHFIPAVQSPFAGFSQR